MSPTLRKRDAITWPVYESLALRLALGPLATFAKSAGRWCVIVMNLEGGGGVTVTDLHRERGRALLEAIGYAVEAGPMAHRTKPIGQQLATAITSALTMTFTSARCPKCKARKVVRLSFGRIVLGHSCRSCKWERARA